MLPTQSAWYSDAKALMLCDKRVAGSGPGYPHRKQLGRRDRGNVGGEGFTCVCNKQSPACCMPFKL